MPSVQQPRIHIDPALFSEVLGRELEELFPYQCTFTNADPSVNEEKVLRQVVEAGGDVFITFDPHYYLAAKSSDVTVLIIHGSVHRVPFPRLPIQDKARALVQLFEQKKEEILGVTRARKDRSVSNFVCIAHVEGTKSSLWTIGEPSTNYENHMLRRCVQ